MARNKSTYATLLAPTSSKTSEVSYRNNDEPIIPDNKEKPLYDNFYNFYRRCRKIRSFQSTWEFVHFKYILELHDIFVAGMKRVDPSIDEDELYSYEFLVEFCSFLYNSSSTRITEGLEPLTEQEQHAYFKYLKAKQDKESKLWDEKTKNLK